MPPRIPLKDRLLVRAFLLKLAAAHKHGWDGMLADAGHIPSATAAGWRYGSKPVTPESPTLLRILVSAGALRPEWAVHFAAAELEASLQVAESGSGQARKLANNDQDGQEKRGSQQ